MSEQTVRYVDFVMGMPISLALRGAHAADELAAGAWAEVMAALHDVDRVFSPFRSDSFVSRLNRGEIGLAACPVEMAEVLRLGKRAKRDSGGAFDVYRSNADGTTTFDPSGVVKGWAVDRAARALRWLDDTDFCLSAGGDMVCHVARPDAPAWRIGIEDPLDPAGVIATVEVRDGAVATSGLTHRGGHIVDARTGEVPTALASVTVVGTDLVRADIDATSAFALGADALGWLEGRRDIAGVVVLADGTARTYGGRSWRTSQAG